MPAVDSTSPSTTGRLLRETVYAQLRSEMISCKLAPGTELREAELATRFEMSKSPVRDALMRLEREGLVITMPRQGYRVAPVSLSDVSDMFHLRAALERACMERIVKSASDEQLISLNVFRRFDGSQWAGSFIAYNRAFHQSLAQLGSNPRLRDQLMDLIDLMERAVHMSVNNIPKGNSESLALEHGALIDALQERAGKRAQRLAEQHILSAGKRVSNAISRSVLTS